MNENQILADFLNLSNPDETKRNEATQNLMNFISLPQFLQYLLQLIVNPDYQSQQNLFIQILIVLKASIKNIYSSCSTSDENYFKTIPITFIKLLDSIPFQYHSYIVDYFRQINHIAYNRSPENTDDNFLNILQISTLPFLIEQIKEQKNFLSNLFILKLFLKYYIKEKEDKETSPFYLQVFQDISPIIAGIINSSEINEYLANSVKVIAQILNHTIDSSLAILKDYFDHSIIIPMVANYSRYFDFEYEHSNALNRHLLKLTLKLSNIYYSIPEFKVSLYPLLFNASMRFLLSNTCDSLIRYYSLKMIFNIYSADFFVNEICSPEFLTTILIPSARMTEDNMSEIASIPYLIQSYYFVKSNEISVRSICYCFASVLLMIPELHAIVQQPSDDPVDFESRVFLLSCLQPVSQYVSDEEIQFIKNLAISSINSNLPFLQASFLYYLNHYVTLISDCSTLVQLAVTCINHSNDPIVILAASDLLKSDRLSFNDIEDNEEKNRIIPKLLSLCVAINCWEPLDAIIKLVKSEADIMNENISILIEIISALFQSCFGIVTKSTTENEHNDIFDPDSERKCHTLSHTFETILVIIENTFISDDLISFCLKQCSFILKEIQSEIYLSPLFSFVSFFNYQLRNPIEDQFEFIMLALSLNEDSALFVLDVCYPLILNPSSNIGNRQSFVQAIAQICQSFITKITVQHEFILCSVDSLLKVCGALIDVFGMPFIGFSEFCFYIFLNCDVEQYFIPLLYLLYTSVKANPSLIFTHFNEEMINSLLKYSVNSVAHSPYYETNYFGTFYINEVKCHFCLLLELARKGREEGAPEFLIRRVEDCFRKAIIVAKSLPYCEDFTTNQNYFARRKFNSALAIRQFPTPIDQIDEWRFFFEVVQQTGFQLSDVEERTINGIILLLKNGEQ